MDNRGNPKFLRGIYPGLYAGGTRQGSSLWAPQARRLTYPTRDIDEPRGPPNNHGMIARVLSAALVGVEAALVRVEVDVTAGLPAFTTVGLPDSAVRESRERVRTAIRNAGFAFPVDRITVNLAPADLRKEGASFDLPIALGILAATGAVKKGAIGPFAVVGELALDGQIQPVPSDEVLEVSAIWSVAGLLPRHGELMTRRPFRAPHHTISVSGLIGGGGPPHPGEVTLAHLGVLFLDELPEFQQHVLESLRQPLEDGRVTIARASGVGDFPARFQLVAAANPCRRGCPSLEHCLCTPAERHRYLGRISRPLLDRIDLHVELPALGPADLDRRGAGDSSAVVRTRVADARERQRERFRSSGILVNASITARQVRRHCQPPPEAEQLLAAAMSRLGLSARGHDRVLKVALTIADLAGSDAIRPEHCAEAIQYRGLDRQWRA